MLLCHVRFWHFASFRQAAENGRYWVHSGHWSTLGQDASVAIDPTTTFAVHRGRGFDVVFSPYQSARLSR
jgi:hypothetical protein